MISGVLMTIVGVWMIVAARRGSCIRRSYRDIGTANLTLQAAIRGANAELLALRAKLALVEGNRAMDLQLAINSLDREERAKAALRATLEETGCTPAQIEGVMSKVENREPGDLR